MIYTKFGTQVDVVGGDVRKAEVEVRMGDGEILKTFVGELKADGGLREIIDEIWRANEKYNIRR